MEIRRCLWELEERHCVLVLDMSTAQMVAAHLLLHADLGVVLVWVRSWENLLEGERGAASCWYHQVEIVCTYTEHRSVSLQDVALESSSARLHVIYLVVFIAFSGC